MAMVNYQLETALTQFRIEVMMYVMLERIKQRKRQVTIDDIKRRCGVITPEKS